MSIPECKKYFDLASLKGLPRDLKPVSQWDSEDSAFLDIIQGIRDVCQSIVSQQQ
jgi:hypothetical protein